VSVVPGAPCLRVKRPGREAEHSHSSSAEVKECVELCLRSPIRLMAWCLAKSTGTTLPLSLYILQEEFELVLIRRENFERLPLYFEIKLTEDGKGVTFFAF